VSDDVQRSDLLRGADDVRKIANEAVRHLRWLAAAGITEAPRPALPAPPMRGPATQELPPSLAIPDAPGGRAAVRSALPPAGLPPAAPGGVPGFGDTLGWRPIAGASASAVAAAPGKGAGSPALRALREELGDCARCKLAPGRTTLVYGVGNPAAELMFVGEGPGADEDREGEPFVGKAGQLLTKMIEAMGYHREQVYIANVVKCRPPENRNPEPDEVQACEPFLRGQIAAIRPRIIVALGKFAAQTLLRDTTPITKLRGRWMAYEGVKLMPTFHPAYLLRSPAEKKKAWEDLQLVMQALAGAEGRR
jgi:uracil-DNA glycosylase